MLKRITLLVVPLMLLGAVGCGDAVDKALEGSKDGILEKLQSAVGDMNLDALKTKAEGASGDVKDKAMSLIGELTGHKTEANGLIDKLKSGGTDGLADLIKKGKDLLPKLTDKLKELKSMLGM